MIIYWYLGDFFWSTIHRPHHRSQPARRFHDFPWFGRFRMPPNHRYCTPLHVLFRISKWCWTYSSCSRTRLILVPSNIISQHFSWMFSDPSGVSFAGFLFFAMLLTSGSGFGAVALGTAGLFGGFGVNCMLPVFWELILETVYGFIRDDVAATTTMLTMMLGSKLAKERTSSKLLIQHCHLSGFCCSCFSCKRNGTRGYQTGCLDFLNVIQDDGSDPGAGNPSEDWRLQLVDELAHGHSGFPQLLGLRDELRLACVSVISQRLILLQRQWWIPIFPWLLLS